MDFHSRIRKAFDITERGFLAIPVIPKDIYIPIKKIHYQNI